MRMGHWVSWFGQRKMIDELEHVVKFSHLHPGSQRSAVQHAVLPMDIELKVLIPALVACPFNTSFTRQRNTDRNLYVAQLKMLCLTKTEIFKVLEPLGKIAA